MHDGLKHNRGMILRGTVLTKYCMKWKTAEEENSIKASSLSISAWSLWVSQFAVLGTLALEALLESLFRVLDHGEVVIKIAAGGTVAERNAF